MHTLFIISKQSLLKWGRHKATHVLKNFQNFGFPFETMIHFLQSSKSNDNLVCLCMDKQYFLHQLFQSPFFYLELFQIFLSHVFVYGWIYFSHSILCIKFFIVWCYLDYCGFKNNSQNLIVIAHFTLLLFLIQGRGCILHALYLNIVKFFIGTISRRWVGWCWIYR